MSARDSGDSPTGLIGFCTSTAIAQRKLENGVVSKQEYQQLCRVHLALAEVLVNDQIPLRSIEGPDKEAIVRLPTVLLRLLETNGTLAVQSMRELIDLFNRALAANNSGLHIKNMTYALDLHLIVLHKLRTLIDTDFEGEQHSCEFIELMLRGIQLLASMKGNMVTEISSDVDLRSIATKILSTQDSKFEKCRIRTFGVLTELVSTDGNKHEGLVSNEIVLLRLSQMLKDDKFSARSQALSFVTSLGSLEACKDKMVAANISNNICEMIRESEVFEVRLKALEALHTLSEGSIDRRRQILKADKSLLIHLHRVVRLKKRDFECLHRNQPLEEQMRKYAEALLDMLEPLERDMGLLSHRVSLKPRIRTASITARASAIHGTAPDSTGLYRATEPFETHTHASVLSERKVSGKVVPNMRRINLSNHSGIW